jgi:hypothetical protein
LIFDGYLEYTAKRKGGNWLMDNTEIATAAMAILVSFLSKPAESLAREAGEAAWNKAGELVDAIRSRLVAQEDDYYQQTMERFEQKPESRQGAMQEVLVELLDEDPQFAQSLSQLIRELNSSGGGTVFNTSIYGGEVGEIINIDTLEGDLSISKHSQTQKTKKQGSSGDAGESGKHYPQLRKNLVQYFSLGDIKDLCHELGLDHENFPGDGKPDLARELVMYCERTERISELVAICQRERPQVSEWIEEDNSLFSQLKDLPNRWRSKD